MNLKKDTSFEYFILPGVLLIAFFVYLPVLKNHLVADSWVFVYKRDLAETFGYFFKSIIPPEWNAQWLRPLPMLTFWADNKIWPGTEWGPHLTNVLFHLVNVFLIMKIVNFSRVYSASSQKKINYGLPEFIAGIFFGLHPLSVGATGWVGARFDVMGITFGLLSVLFLFLWDSGGKKTSSFALFLASLTLALLCKEQSIIFFITAFFYGLIMTFREKITQEYLPIIISSLAIPVVYAIYRFSIFHGAGGYLESGGQLNFVAPVAFLTAIVFPWLNVIDNWSLSILFWISSLLISLIAIILWNSFRRTPAGIKMVFILIPSLITLTGLATTLPHAGIGFMDILGHAESRFSLVAIAGISILAGLISAGYLKSAKSHKIAVLIILVLGIGFSWRTGVQLQAWGDAGNTAHNIISVVLSEAPEPPHNSKMYFFEIPRGNEQFAYIFGIGLKEAILRNYPGRDDIEIISKASGKDLNKVDTRRDFVFGFNKSRWQLERLYARKN